MTLEEIREAIVSDPDNVLYTKKGWPPVYAAHKKAKILIVGQAPGRIAQETRTPWNDPSGDNLRAWMNIERGTFYDETKIALVPMDFYFPGSLQRGDAPPRKGFAEKWHPVILSCMPDIKLKILIGQYAHAYYLANKRKKTLTDTVRAYKEYSPDVIPLVHPSPRNYFWQKKNPWFKDKIIPYLQQRAKNVLSS